MVFEDLQTYSVQYSLVYVGRVRDHPELVKKHRSNVVNEPAIISRRIVEVVYIDAQILYHFPVEHLLLAPAELSAVHAVDCHINQLQYQTLIIQLLGDIVLVLFFKRVQMIS